MIKLSLLIFIVGVLFAQSSKAELTSFGLQCASADANELKTCLKKEAEKIDEANLPNEIILQNEDSGKASLLKLIAIRTAKKHDTYTERLQALIPTIESSVATAVIIQYENEPQLYFYAIDKNGKLEVIFDGMNSVDISELYSEIFENEPEVFYLKSPNVSKTFIEWLEFLKE